MHVIFINEQKSDGLKLKKYEYMVLDHYELIISYYYYRLECPANQNCLPTMHIDTPVYKQNEKLLNINAPANKHWKWDSYLIQDSIFRFFFLFNPIL